MIFADFKEECLKQLEAKKLASNKKYVERLHFELGILEAQAADYKQNIFSYFIDLREQCKNKKIKNSNHLLVSYVLDITDEDPIKADLDLIKTKAAEYPDIDTDFEDVQREHVKEYLIEKYGRENVASICAMHQMHPKTVIKDISRIKNIPFEEVNEVTKFIKDKMTVDGKEQPTSIMLAYNNIPEVRQFFNKYDYVNLLMLCIKLEGNIRHLGMHAAGVVITPKSHPLEKIVGLEKTKDVYVTCWQEGDDRELSKVGLIKFDILGLNTLSVLKNAMQMIRQNHKVDVDINNLDLDDKKVLNGFYEGNTVGVFQFEKLWIRNLLKKIKITTFEDISAVNALNRPGPLDAKMDEKFWKIKNGFEKPSYLHPLLEPILKNTYCIILYQEQVMEIAQKLAGFAADEADVFRSVLSKGKADLSKGINPFEKHEKKFIEGCLRNGVKGKIKVEKIIRYEAEMPTTATNVKILQETSDAIGPYKKISCEVEIADELFSQIKTFAGYGFNKSHSIEYALIAYQCMYLKNYYPLEFMASLLSNTPNKMDIKGEENKFIDYFFESKRMGIKILPPSVNKSQFKFFVSDKNIQAGFCYIKGLGEKAITEMVKKRPYKSFRDFLTKVDGRSVNKSAILALIHSGCFDEFLEINNNRKNLVLRYDLVREYISFKKDKKTEVPESPHPIDAIMEESNVSGGEIFNNVLHLIDKHKASEGYEADDKIMKFSALDKIHPGTTIRICAVVEKYFAKEKDDGKWIGFLELKSGVNIVKVMIWNSEVVRIRAEERFIEMFKKNSVITCRIERRNDYKNGKTFCLKLEGIKKLL